MLSSLWISINLRLEPIANRKAIIAPTIYCSINFYNREMIYCTTVKMFCLFSLLIFNLHRFDKSGAEEWAVKDFNFMVVS